ncbi:hypothetical protein [Ramlibacter sp. WS9]|uniref:hypothetical protein n=1 Tax=Ramlibacter sp. WS9 TaxID=1882741 RepID=UPI001141456B|nr:hypothetical protein [Ramlibacter sp. WS9]
MASTEDPIPASAPVRLGRSILANALAIYVALACAGVAILLSFVPDLFDGGDLSLGRLLALVAVAAFVVGPVIAVAYIFFEALFEAAVRGIGWVFTTCFHAVVRSFRRIFGGTEE